MKTILYTIFTLLFLTISINSQNTNPVVSNVAFSILDHRVTVSYDIADPNVGQNTFTVGMVVSSDNGVTWDYFYNSPAATGDIGAGIVTGIGKTITWTYGGVFNNQFKIRIFANDNVADGSSCGTVDYGGQTYNTIQISSQCWLKENLNVGIRIDGHHEQTSGVAGIEKYCYGDNEANCTSYGGLYQWAETVQYLNGASWQTIPNPQFTGNIQGICPPGWHLPTDKEFQALKTAVNSGSNLLKAAGQGSSYGVGTNTSGFSALLAGNRSSYDGTFAGIFSGPDTGNTYFWSSTNDGYYGARGQYYNGIDNTISLTDLNKKEGISVRCVKNN